MSAQTLEAGHETCTHYAYRLSCEEAHALLLAAGGCCQRCGQRARRLVYDHDHMIGWQAVRGVVCDPCNQHLGRVDNGMRDPDTLDVSYLSNPWHGKNRPGLAARLTRRKPRMVMRSFRVPEKLWEDARDMAGANQQNISDVVRELLERYVKRG